MASKRQKSTAISSMEAEYIALSGLSTADIFTKALAETGLNFLINKLGNAKLFTARDSETIGNEVMNSSVTYSKIHFDESNANVLERFYTSAGNPVKEILLKLNLPDHRILKDGGEST
ncbi:hypothetical protein Tco_0979331 [Tanacetum coccineum]